MSENTGDTSSRGLSRRDALKAGGTAAAGAMFFGAMGAGAADAASTPWTQADYLNFAKVVNAVWKKPALRQQYQANPTAFLKTYNIALPPGTPPPTIPAAPKTALGYATTGSKAFRTQVVASDVQLDFHVTNISPSVAVSTLCCVACPVSSFSSLSNG
jgi:hypothetical protein